MSEQLLTHLDSRGVFTITMQRPDVHNAFDEDQIARLTDALQTAADDIAVRVVVLGSMGKHFCAGADINYMKRMGENTRDQNVEDARALATLMHVLDTLPKPTVARIQGAAYGGAVGLVSCCDVAVGANSTVLSLSEVKIGLVPGTIGPYVIRAVGQRTARRLFITGERVAAHAAQAMGLLHNVVEDDQLDDAVEGIVDALLENSPSAMAIAKELVSELSPASIDDKAIEQSVLCIADVRESPDGKEGTLAFLEKRKPDWNETT